MTKICSFFLILFSALIMAQEANVFAPSSQLDEKDLPSLFVTKDINLLFRSPEPVQFVDISSDRVAGDLPAENIVRLKVMKYAPADSIQINPKEFLYRQGETLGVVTIVAQSFMAQYKLVYTSDKLLYGGDTASKAVTNVQIQEKDMQPIKFANFNFSDFELKRYALNLIKEGPKKNIRKNEDLKMGANINNIYAVSDYIFMDVTFTNSTNIPYDIGNVEFTIDDKKIYKATNNQTVPVEPVFQLYKNNRFRTTFRNIYVFKKFTFPNNKVLKVRIYEKGISGRTLTTELKYSDLLNADTF